MEARAGMLAQRFSRATDKVRCREARLSEEKGRLLRGTPAALGAFWAIGGCIGRGRPLRAPLPPDAFQPGQDYSTGGGWLGGDLGKLLLR